MIGDEEEAFLLVVGAGVSQATFDQNLETIFWLWQIITRKRNTPLGVDRTSDCVWTSSLGLHLSAINILGNVAPAVIGVITVTLARADIQYKK